MEMFERPARGLPFKGAFAVTIALTVLSACSGLKEESAIPTGANPLSNAVPRPLKVTSADFRFVAVWGSKGNLAVAQCPQGFKVVAGGSSSNNGTSVGTGYANSALNSWIVMPESGASAEAFATCFSRSLPSSDFKWSTYAAISGIAAAKCSRGYVLVTGYGMGTDTASWYDNSTNTYWVIGGGTAYASCAVDGIGVVIEHAWNRSQKPKTVYAGCPKGYTVIGGAMGSPTWPGPPIQEHPGLQSGPGTHGYAGWWTFSNALNELTWASCVRT
jgi:hypothetical protein